MSALPEAAGADWPPAVEWVNAGGGGDVVLLCEHAANHLPARYGGLGLGPEELLRHIAYDPGAAAVTRALALAIDAPALLGTYSRLLVDLNRPFGVPSSMPVLSEATVVPGNRDLTEAERRLRRETVFDPFHAAVARTLDARATAGRPTRLVTVHSFTPVFLGVSRPWHVGVLFERANPLSDAMIRAFEADPALVVGVNEPYRVGRDEDYAIPVHAIDRGLEGVLVEIRNDLVRTPEGVAEWVGRLAAVLGRDGAPTPPRT